jgi:hypothetical protein
LLNPEAAPKPTTSNRTETAMENIAASPRLIEETPPPAPGRWRRVWKEVAWFFLVLAVLPTHREALICLGVVAVVALAFWRRYYPREWLLFAIGSGLGLVFELGGDAIYKLQSWSEGSLFGIPTWLPLFWGLGFVFIRRFGNAVLAVPENA